jgi:hypothetical protein
MNSHSHEILGPENLAEVSALFEKTWAVVTSSDDAHVLAQDRAQLACIVLRLYQLRQLGPDQVLQTALRIFRPAATREAFVISVPVTDAAAA